MREMLGITQQSLADRLGVKPLSVKRWEIPRYPQNAPDSVWQYLEQLENDQRRACEKAATRLYLDYLESQDSGSEELVADVPYWSSASDYESSTESDGVTWTEANASSRRLAAILADRGIPYRWVNGAHAEG